MEGAPKPLLTCKKVNPNMQSIHKERCIHYICKLGKERISKERDVQI